MLLVFLLHKITLEKFSLFSALAFPFIKGEVLCILFHAVVLSLAWQAAKYHDEILEICSK